MSSRVRYGLEPRRPMQKSFDSHVQWCLELLSNRVGYWCPVIGVNNGTY